MEGEHSLSSTCWGISRNRRVLRIAGFPEDEESIDVPNWKARILRKRGAHRLGLHASFHVLDVMERVAAPTSYLTEEREHDHIRVLHLSGKNQTEIPLNLEIETY